MHCAQLVVYLACSLLLSHAACVAYGCRFPHCVIALLGDSRLSCTAFPRLRTFIRLFTGIQPHVGTLDFITSIYYYFVYLQRVPM
ncbi:hypothetical protein EDB85DRAFT_1929973, partial [Lactarius pseudohatsudake]